jgi:hypothetical protein
MDRSLLVLLSQSPFDPASGAARSVLEAARVLAGQGFRVRLLATTASAAAKPIAPMELLLGLGVRPEVDRRPTVGKGCPVLRFVDRGVECTLMDTGALAAREVDFLHGVQFGRLLLNELERHTPEVVLTAGGGPADQDRRALCREAGAIVVLSLHSLGYLHPLAFDHVDAAWACSAFVAERYREVLGVPSTVLHPIVSVDEARPEAAGDSGEVVFVNPTPGKGVYLATSLCSELARARPGLRMTVVESRGTGEQFFTAGAHGGFDLEAACRPVIRPLQASAAAALAGARVLLMPSVAEEPFGRLAAEARALGLAVVASGVGGLPEALGRDGVALPAGLTVETDRPVATKLLGPWVEAVLAGLDGAAPERAEPFSAERLGPAYAAFVRGLQPAAAPLVVAG